jgi:hypothetical protein
MCTCSCSWSASFSRLSRLGRLDWFPLRPSSSKGGAKRTTLHRLRHRPAAQTIAPPVVSPPLPRRVESRRLRMSRPWPEVKSRRGAPKRIDTEGFACPNPQCPYSGITEAHIHASFWRWQAWACRANPDLSRPCLPHHLQCSTPHAFVPSENPFSPGRRGALCAGRRAGSFGGLAGRRATDKPPSPRG